MIGSLHALRNGNMTFLSAMAAYGDIAYARLGPNQTYCLHHPELIERVLLGRDCNVVKSRLVMRVAAPLGGTGLLTSEGESWRRQRKLAGPPLQAKRIAGYADAIGVCARRWSSSVRDGETRDAYADMLRLTLEIAGKTLLGFDPREESERIELIMRECTQYLLTELSTPLALLPPQIMTLGRMRVRKLRRELEVIFARIIQRCRAGTTEAQQHFFARLVHASDADGHALSDAELIDEGITMLMAGHETTALTLGYALYLLSANPIAQAQALAEVDVQLAGRSMVAADLPRLPVLNAVVRETLRLFPPVYLIAREAVEAFELGGHVIPKGGCMLISPWIVQRDPRFFRDPERFAPERWLDGPAPNAPRFAYFPFGGGPRVCVANQLAMLETMAVLASLLPQLELRVAKHFALKLDAIVTLFPRNGVRLQFRRRSGLPARA